eukprot:COSAG02_NODE_22562_length_748_cov_0.861325_1_plen_70_part_10
MTLTIFPAGKSYNPDRAAIAPHCAFMVGVVLSMRALPAYDGSQVFRGVKLDLSKDYVKGREVTWHGFCSC